MNNKNDLNKNANEQSENTHEAGDAYRKALATPPPSASMSFLTAKRHLNARDYKKALDCLLRTEKLFPEFPKLYRHLASVHAGMEQFDKSVEAYRKAIKADGEDTELLQGLGAAYMELGATDKADTAFKRAVELDPKNALSWYQLGLLHGMMMYDYSQGIAYCRKAYALNTDLPRLEHLLGILLTQNEQPKEGLPFLQKAHKKEPNVVETNMWLGMAYTDLKMYDQALLHLQRAADLRPNDWRAYFHKGLTYKRMEHDKQAIACFQHAFKLDPTNGDLPWEIAFASIRLNKYLDFLLYARKAAALGHEEGIEANKMLEMTADIYQKASRTLGPMTKEEFKMGYRKNVGDFLSSLGADFEDAICELVINADKYEDPTGYVIGTHMKEGKQEEMRKMDLPSRKK